MLNSENAFYNIIQQLPGLIMVMDKQSRFMYSNNYTAKLLGFKNEEQLIGLSAYNVRCQAAESAELFFRQDQEVLRSKNTLFILDVHTYAHNQAEIYLTEKKPYYECNEIKGIIGRSTNLHSDGVNRLISTITQLDKKYYPKNNKIERSYTTNQLAHSKSLTQRELECVFYMLRGKTAREIALLLHLSPRTVEKYIENIKIKINCNTRSELIDYAIANGYLSYVPKKLLINSKASIVLFEKSQ